MLHAVFSPGLVVLAGDELLVAWDKTVIASQVASLGSALSSAGELQFIGKQIKSVVVERRDLGILCRVSSTCVRGLLLANRAELSCSCLAAYCLATSMRFQ